MDRPKTLSAAFVRTINQPGRYGDGRGSHGLSLLVRKTRNGRWSKTWSQRLRVNGRPVMIGLGSYPVVALAEARGKCLENRRAVEQGRDPRGGSVPTFEQATDKVLALHRDTWKPGGRSEQQWVNSMAAYVMPALGHKRIDQINVGDILEVLAEPWATRPATARRIAGRISAVLTWAVGAGHRDSDPTAAAVAALPRQAARPKHHAAIPHAEMAVALSKIRASNASPAARLAVELAALTAARSAEVRGATWDEIDIDAAVWEIAEARTKTKTVHRVALSSQALAVLAEARALSDGPTVFPSPATGRPLPHTSPARVLAAAGLNDVTAHGLRSSFRSWCSDVGHPRDLAELCLGHVVRNPVERAYARSDMLERRRPLMEDWARYIA